MPWLSIWVSPARSHERHLADDVLDVRVGEHVAHVRGGATPERTVEALSVGGSALEEADVAAFVGVHCVQYVGGRNAQVVVVAVAGHRPAERRPELGAEQRPVAVEQRPQEAKQCFTLHVDLDRADAHPGALVPCVDALEPPFDARDDGEVAVGLNDRAREYRQRHAVHLASPVSGRLAAPDRGHRHRAGSVADQE